MVERSVKWPPGARKGPVGRACEPREARWGGGAGALDTSGPAGGRGLRARSVLDVVEGAGSGEVELFA